MVQIAVYSIFAYSILSMINAPTSSTVILAKNGKKSSVIINTKKSKTVIDKPNTYVQLTEKSESKIKQISDKEIYLKFKDVIEHTPKKPTSILLYFLKGKNELDEESKNKISTIIREIKSRKTVDLNIIGHTDTVGSNKLNAKLSLKRALFVKELLLKNKLKLNSLEVNSYGENDLLVQTEDEVSEPKNRRVEVFIK